MNGTNLQKIELVIKEPLISLNHMYRSTGRGVYLTERGRCLKNIIGYQALNMKKFLDGDLSMKISVYFGDKRKRDVDNYGKVLIDSIKGILFKDDDQIQSLTIEKFYDKASPRTVVTIQKL